MNQGTNEWISTEERKPNTSTQENCLIFVKWEISKLHNFVHTPEYHILSRNSNYNFSKNVIEGIR